MRRSGQSFFFFLLVLFGLGIGLIGHANAAGPISKAEGPISKAAGPISKAGGPISKAAGLEPLSLITATGEHVFEIELAATPTARALGLMHRKTLAPRHGMLFDFGRPITGVTMWMKDTLIPLDMLFLGPDGQIWKIAAETSPGSLEPIGTDHAVRAVLELPGGTAARLGLKTGDRAVHGIFPTAQEPSGRGEDGP